MRTTRSVPSDKGSLVTATETNKLPPLISPPHPDALQLTGIDLFRHPLPAFGASYDEKSSTYFASPAEQVAPVLTSHRHHHHHKATLPPDSDLYSPVTTMAAPTIFAAKPSPSSYIRTYVPPYQTPLASAPSGASSFFTPPPVLEGPLEGVFEELRHPQPIVGFFRELFLRDFIEDYETII